MAKIDCLLHWNVTFSCNLNCAYCFPREKERKIQSINIPKLIKTLDNSNKTFLIGFTGGGEPFLVPNIIDACKEITKKHYISFNTNLISGKIKEFSEQIDPKRVLLIIASMHLKEMERTGLFSKYLDNFIMLQKRGFNIICREVAYPSLFDEIGKYKKLMKEKDIELKFEPFNGKYGGKKYPEAYTKKEISAFGLRNMNIYHQKNKLCNAGYNVGMVTPKGDISCCCSIYDSTGNIYNEIRLKDKMIRCPLNFCGSPLKEYYPYLFERALMNMHKKQILNVIDYFYGNANKISKTWGIPLSKITKQIKFKINRLI